MPFRPHATGLLLALLAVTGPAAAQTTSAPDQPTPPLSVGFLALDGVYNSELMAPYDIFHHTKFHVKPGMRVFTIGRTTDPVRTFEGLTIAVDYDLEHAPPIDVLVIPSAEGNMGPDLEDTRLIEWIRDRGRRARYAVSICDGAFLLAEAGLLDGRYCTTFPGDIDALRTRYGATQVVEGVSFVADGSMITGVGGARSYDPALFLVEHLYGPVAARGVARGMALSYDGETIRRLNLVDRASVGARPSCYLPGDRIDAGVTVETADGVGVSLHELIRSRPDVRAVVLCILAGGEATPGKARGGIWCEDSFSEIANLRLLHLTYAERGVLFVGVLCPPVFHEAQFGYDEDAFWDSAHERYQANVERFVDASAGLVDTVGLPFDLVGFNPRFTLLGAPEAGDPPWHGRFKWFEDDQTYGTPTTWVLNGDGVVVGPAFYKNVYESPGRKLRYTARDVAEVLDRLVQ
ncbi:MAG: hypothetical protein HKN62_06365 [Phycisphaerales bacterium]|nr:hypothetical protein [Phycisphaerales bacterium]